MSYLLIRAHCKAGARYAAAYTEFRDAYCELRALERTAGNSNIAVPLGATFPNSSLPDPREFRHSDIVPMMPWDSWKVQIETRHDQLVKQFRKET
jgi:hypothetical protein